jgi:hypothetical protein
VRQGRGAGTDAGFAACDALRPPAEGGARDRGAGHVSSLTRGCPMPSTSEPRGRSVRKRAPVGAASRARECQSTAPTHQGVGLNRSSPI